MPLIPIVGVLEEMKGKWWPVTMHPAKVNGFTFGAKVLLVSREENGSLQTIVERWICYQMNCNTLFKHAIHHEYFIMKLLTCYHGTIVNIMKFYKNSLCRNN